MQHSSRSMAKSSVIKKLVLGYCQEIFRYYGNQVVLSLESKFADSTALHRKENML